jgi:beta-galactosidase
MQVENGRKRLSLNKDWSFLIGDVPQKRSISHDEIYGRSKAGSKIGPPQNDFEASEWKKVDLPHDFIINLPFDKEGAADWGYKPKETAWYRKCFSIDEKEMGNQILIEFEGIATHSTIYFNGSIVKRNWSAYNGIVIDITDRVFYGDTPNTLAVFVDATQWEGWWYEGGGIYRDAWLTIKPQVNIKTDGIYVNPIKVDDITWNTNIEIIITNTLYEDKKVKVRSKLYNQKDELIGEGISVLYVKGYSETKEKQTIIMERPRLWDINDPNLYYIKTEVIHDGVSDEEITYFGYRTIHVDAKKGFFLNDRHVKLYGTCNHQDHAGVGVALSSSLHEYRITKLKEMGSNAYRCAHGMPSKEFLNACDRLGMLVMDENRNFETSEEGLEQLRGMVVRDRNHPSIVMYAIFNEEPLQGTIVGMKMASRMLHEIKKLDDTRFVTAAMHDGVLDKDSAGQVLDVVGINYQPKSYDAFHEMYPNTPIVASETTSSFSVRGCYHNDEEVHRLASYDENPADLGNTLLETWESIKDRDFVMGAFLWTGFDYLGEPTPYTYPSVSSFFGMLDTCGFEKEGFYLCKAFWSREPFCHVLPHWNHNEGEIIKVMSHTNCEEAEVFVNGKSYGRKETPLTKQASWEIPYEPGTLELVGYNHNVEVARDTVKTTNKETKLIINPSRNIIYNDGSDAVPFNISAVDDAMQVVPTSNLLTKIEVVEGGVLIGTGNGDPNCHEDFKGNQRSLFSGKCQAIIRANKNAKELIINVTADGLEEAVITFPLTERKRKFI